MLSSLWLWPLGLALSSSNEPAWQAEIELEAHIAAEALEVGGTYEVTLDLVLPDTWTTSQKGMAHPMLQLDVPPSVKLVGKELTEYEELARNEFLNEPYERLLESLPAKIPFELVAEPGEGERLGLIVTTYVVASEGYEQRFFRRRLELPIGAGARSEVGDRNDTGWGTSTVALKVGDPAPDFEVQRGDGSPLMLSHYLGEKNIIVTTYRAHW